MSKEPKKRKWKPTKPASGVNSDTPPKVAAEPKPKNVSQKPIQQQPVQQPIQQQPIQQQPIQHPVQQQQQDLSERMNQEYNERKSQGSGNRATHNVNHGNDDISQNEVVDKDADLKSFLKKNSPMAKNNDTNIDIDTDALLEIEKFESAEGLNDIPSTPFNPLDESVKERAYTSGINPNQAAQNPANPNQPPPVERIIDEPKYPSAGSSSVKLDVDDDLINPSTTNDIPQDKPKDKKPDNVTNDGGAANNGGGGSEKTEKAEKVGHENTKTLSIAEKMAGVEKTAEAILIAYKNYVPLPFIHFSSYDIKNLKKLHKKDEIDLETKVRKDGTTFIEHAEQHNKKAEKTFIIEQEEVESLRQPLIDVLMENDIAFTPMQRLLFVAGQHLVVKAMACKKLVDEMKADMDEMKEIHLENQDLIRRQELNLEREEALQKSKEKEREREAKAQESEKEREREAERLAAAAKVTVSKQSESGDTSKGTITDAKIVEETSTKKANVKVSSTPTLEDALEMNEQEEEHEEEEKENDIPN